MNTLAIDPGLDTGWALLDANRVLLDAGLGSPPTNLVYGRFVIERPQVYPRSSPKQSNDLITLAIMVGRYKERYERPGVFAEEILPRTWKGTLDPDVCTARILDSLPPDERVTLNRKLDLVANGKQHNVVDAVGLGKWSLKRGRAAVF